MSAAIRAGRLYFRGVSRQAWSQWIHRAEQPTAELCRHIRQFFARDNTVLEFEKCWSQHEPVSGNSVCILRLG